MPEMSLLEMLLIASQLSEPMIEENEYLEDDMSTGQYRAIVAYLNFWTPKYPQMSIDIAIKDIGISISRKAVICQLSKYGWKFDDSTGLIKYDDEDEADD